MMRKRDYFGLEYTLSLILAIIPFTCWLCGLITAVYERRFAEILLRIFFGFSVVWILDIVFMITRRKIFRFSVL